MNRPLLSFVFISDFTERFNMVLELSPERAIDDFMQRISNEEDARVNALHRDLYRLPTRLYTMP